MRQSSMLLVNTGREARNWREFQILARSAGVHLCVCRRQREADMSKTDVEPGAARKDGDREAGVACGACQHPLDSHDAIARRYCTATLASGFHRGCVCVGEHNESKKDGP